MGKDTIANHMCSKLNYNHVKITEPLKLAVRNLFNMTYDQVEGDLKDTVDPTWGVTPRRVMQFVGTEMFQFKIQEIIPHIGREFWIRKVMNDIVACPLRKSYVISDLRFRHEVDFLQNVFNRNGIQFLVLAVHRDLNDYDPTIDSHVSEKEYVTFPHDEMIHNCGTIENLHEKIDDIFSQN